VRGSPYWPACCVFVILLSSYAFFWHSRDWNTASRLMLTYALVDRGAVAINGLEAQTLDRALFRGQYYSDKPPGYSLLAALPYALGRAVFRLPAHPLDRGAFPYWPADYWVTLFTSGLLTALTAVLLVIWARDLGCPPCKAALVGLAYGLSTPAYVYATLAYGHQASAFALFASFFLLFRPAGRRDSLAMFLAGFLAAYAAVIELPVGLVSAILGLCLVAQCLRGVRRRKALAAFALGAALPTLTLLAYNMLAFGSPWEMGYFHEEVREFARVHSRANPLGLDLPDPGKIIPLLLGGYRGLAFYAPIVLMTPFGWAALWARRAWDVAVVSFLVVVAVLLVNLSYPEWTGGWSTGPRLLVPLLPFALLPVAALLAAETRLARVVCVTAVALALAGGIVMLLFQGVGARVPHYFAYPFRDAVWPLWSGQALPGGGWAGGRFCRSLVSILAPGWVGQLPAGWQGLQFLPLVLAQGVAIGALWRLCRPGRAGPNSGADSLGAQASTAPATTETR
jgi:hypothetical protein